MITYQSEVTIARPPEQVWPYLVEREKQALWSDVPMTPLTEGPVRTGSQMRLSFGEGPMRASLTLEMTAVETGRRLAYTTISKGGIHWEGEYRLEPTETGGSHLRQQGTLRFSGLWRVAEPVVGAEIKRGEIAELERLKTVVESAT